MEYIEKMLEDWKNLFDKNIEFYIYGAAESAKKCLELSQKTGVLHKIKGFVVSNGKENPSYVENIPVTDIHDIQNKEIHILVTHLGFAKKEICKLLEELGFKNVYLIAKYMEALQLKYAKKIDDECKTVADKRETEMLERRTSEERKKDEEFCKYIGEIRKQEELDFGSNLFYQSFEKIGLVGRRPTLYRLEKYGIEKFLNENMDVLDIGCNVGFVDLTVAPLVKSVLGIEYDAPLVKIANDVKEYMQAWNCEFIQSDFEEWYKGNKRKFDVVFSFAVHHWLNLAPEKYMKMLDDIIKEHGYLCLESLGGADFDTDKEYKCCLKYLLDMGYVVQTEGKIVDDGIMLRRYAVLKTGSVRENTYEK